MTPLVVIVVGGSLLVGLVLYVGGIWIGQAEE